MFLFTYGPIQTHCDGSGLAEFKCLRCQIELQLGRFQQPAIRVASRLGCSIQLRKSFLTLQEMEVVEDLNELGEVCFAVISQVQFRYCNLFPLPLKRRLQRALALRLYL